MRKLRLRRYSRAPIVPISVHVSHFRAACAKLIPVDLSAPYRAVLSEPTGRILRVLAGTTRHLTGREVTRLSGVPRSTAARALQHLVEHGLVRAQEAGSALLYHLNRDHLATQSVLALVDLRRQLMNSLKVEFESWKIPPIHASMFGSAARGDGDTASDIDLLIVRPCKIDADDEIWRKHIDLLPRLILNWTGNHAGIMEIAEPDLKSLRRDRPPVIQEVEHDAITLVGPDPRELFQESVR